MKNEELLEGKARTHGRHWMESPSREQKGSLIKEPSPTQIRGSSHCLLREISKLLRISALLPPSKLRELVVVFPSWFHHIQWGVWRKVGAFRLYISWGIKKSPPIDLMWERGCGENFWRLKFKARKLYTQWKVKHTRQATHIQSELRGGQSAWPGRQGNLNVLIMEEIEKNGDQQ